MRINSYRTPRDAAIAICLCICLCHGTCSPACGHEPPVDIQGILAQTPRVDTQELPDLHIVLLADTKDHGPAGNGLHDYPLWQQRWALLLGGAEASSVDQVNLDGPPIPHADLAKGAPGVHVSTAWNWPSDEQFASADVIVAFCYMPWTESHLATMRRYLANGGGLVLVHSATWTRPEPSTKVAELVGVGGFQRYRHGPVSLTIAAPQHPICLGLPPGVILPNDETYWPPTPLMDQATVLAQCAEAEESAADSAAHPQPMLWCYPLNKGRVFGCVPGHCGATFDDPLFRILLLRGIAWSAGSSPYRLDCLVLRGSSPSSPQP